MKAKLLLIGVLILLNTPTFSTSSLKHQNEINCFACEKILKICSPILIDWFTKEHKNDPCLHIMQAYRNEKQQNAALKHGASKVGWGKSAHNYIPCLAIDLFFIVDGKSKTPPVKYKPLIARLPQTIENGSSIKGLVDWGHFQVKNWQSMALNYPYGNIFKE